MNHFTMKASLTPPRTNDEVPEDYFKDLSDELVLYIFSYLPKTTLKNCGLTCQRFRHLSLDQTLWKRLDLNNKSISGELLHILIGRGIQYLRLSRTTICGKYWPRSPPKIPSLLHYLDLSMAICTEPVILYEILCRCVELVAVSLENCPINNSVCRALSRNPNLKILNLSTVKGLTAAGIQFILTSCRRLEQLNVAWTNLDRDTVATICTIAPNTMQRLNIAGTRGDVLIDEDVISLCGRCPNLVELDLSDASELTFVSVHAIATTLMELVSLSCSRCYKIDPTAYSLLPPKLNELNIFNSIHEGSMNAFLQMLPEGVNLNVSAFSKVARPTVAPRRTSIWEQRIRDD